MAMAPSISCGVSFPTRPASASASVVRPRGSVAVVRAAAARVEGAAAAGGKWWAPLLGWSGRADYLDAAIPAPVAVTAAREDPQPDRRVSGGGLLTEEKAREMRARMAETECFHDAMYHSAIASRLARSSA